MIWILFAVTGSISSSITLMAATSIGKFLPFGKLYLKEEIKENKKEEIKFLHFGFCFVCRFDYDDDDLDIPGAGNQSGSFCLLTPYRSYHWPGDQTALLAELGRQGYSNGHRQDDDVCQSPLTK